MRPDHDNDLTPVAYGKHDWSKSGRFSAEASAMRLGLLVEAIRITIEALQFCHQKLTSRKHK